MLKSYLSRNDFTIIFWKNMVLVKYIGIFFTYFWPHTVVYYLSTAWLVHFTSGVAHMETNVLFCSKLMLTNLWKNFWDAIYSNLYFCQTYSWNKTLCNYSQYIHLVGSCHRWLIIGRCWYNDHQSYKYDRFPSLITSRINLRHSKSWDTS